MLRFTAAATAASENLTRLAHARNQAVTDLERALGPCRETLTVLAQQLQAAIVAAAAAEDTYRPLRVAVSETRSQVAAARSGLAHARRLRRVDPLAMQTEAFVVEAETKLAAALTQAGPVINASLVGKTARDATRLDLVRLREAHSRAADLRPESVDLDATQRLASAQSELTVAAVALHSEASKVAREALLSITDLNALGSAATEAVTEVVKSVTASSDPVLAARLAGILLPVFQQAGQDLKKDRRARVAWLLRSGVGGYGKIAGLLELSRGRVQQIANDVASGRPVHQDQTQRRDLKALIRDGMSMPEAAKSAGVTTVNAQRLVTGSGRPPGRPPGRPRRDGP